MTGKMAPDCDGDCAVAISFARIAALSPPVVPPGLAERIIRDVPHLAQLPAPFAPLRAPLRARALRLVITPPVRRSAAGRRPVAGWAALAAGLGAIALMLPSAFPARQPAQAAAAPPPRQIARVQPTPVRVAVATRSVAPRALTIHAATINAVTVAINQPGRMPGVLRASSLVVPLPAVPDAVIPVVTAQPLAAQVAEVIPVVRPVYGPPDTEAPSSRGLSPRGGGQGAAPGFALTGYAPGH